MMFSVVIPLYNKAPYVRGSIESVLAQTADDFEIVVVDDGSTDQSAAIVESIGDPRIRLIRQENAGVSAARNRGIRDARGDWIAFFDADDWLHPRYLATLQNLVAKHPGVDAVATRYKSLAYSKDEAIEAWPISPSDSRIELIDDLPKRWLKGTCFCASSVAIRHALLRTMQPCFPVGESAGEDLDLWFRVGEKTSIAMSTEPLIARIWVPDGLSVVHRARREPPFLLRMERRASSSTFPAKLSGSTQRFVNESRVTLARAAISAGQRRLAAGLLWRARGAAAHQRWWITLVMLLVMPGRAVQAWKQWRQSRHTLT